MMSILDAVLDALVARYVVIDWRCMNADAVIARVLAKFGFYPQAKEASSDEP